ncbi:NAD(P)/FAD-dependent oxidoreductase [Novosphingobium sp. Chol11]|uniref:flavin-containing monooxygenase n=1 Tax=Novosphingobium sp. Chol11 TaxID=1385763 RepID=UPI0025DBE993|nr:NAD(P)/FAD-dependent oxidoreductase [Novosphingobium sp. Chol11]
MSDTESVGRSYDALREKYLGERNRRLRSEGNDQYVAVDHPFIGDVEDPYVSEPLERAPISEDLDVVVVGGGFSGLLAATSLIREGVTDVRIVEKGSDVGGTWYWNRYPGCRCDVEAYSYLPLIEDHGEMPSERYARAPEILDHARRIARQTGIYDKALLQTGVSGAAWDEARGRWIVTTDRGDELRARFLCMASGILSRPKLPGILGAGDFKGHTFHTSRWDYVYTKGDNTGGLTDLQDKRVAIIGTGASAVQAIPHLGEWCQQLYVVQRTPAAVDDRENAPTDPDWWNSQEPGWWERRALNFEGFVNLIPQEVDLIQDGWTRNWGKMTEAMYKGKTPEEMGALRQQADYEKMEAMRTRIAGIVIDPDTAEALKPYFNWMCKRPLFVDNYFETYNRPNVNLIDTKGRGLDRITETGIMFDGTEYPVDCIIYASGFEVASPPDRTAGFDMRGVGGMTLSDYWTDGRRSLHGMLVHNFPNMAIISGLKQSGITWNITFMNRRQAEHYAALVKRCLDRGVNFDVTDAAEQGWLEVLADKAQKDDTFFRECTPGYYNNEGKNERDSIFLSNYGGGPFEYMDVLRCWIGNDAAVERDLALTPAV